MDAASLRARIQAGLTFRHQVGDYAFTLVLPTRQRHDQIVRESVGVTFLNSAASLGRYRVALVQECLRGWEGVRVRDIWPEGDETSAPLPYGADTAQLLIEERTDWVDLLYDELVRRIEARAAALKADRGNSPSGSPGSGGEPTTTSTTPQA